MDVNNFLKSIDGITEEIVQKLTRFLHLNNH